MATFIASIGSYDFMLSSLEQAEQLLRILSTSTLVDESYVGEPGGGGKYVLHKTDNDARISVKLSQVEPISYVEYVKLRDEAHSLHRTDLSVLNKEGQ